LYLRFKKVPLLAWADIAAPTLGLGLMFTRIGCYLYGCDFGAPLREGAPAALQRLGTFPRWDAATEGGPKLLCDQTISGSPAFSHHVAEYDLPATAQASMPVHPTQLYESLAGLVLFGLCMLVWHRRQFRGQVIIAIAAGYALWRFAIEYMRDDPQRGEAFGFSTSQLISLGLIPVLGFAYLTVQRRFRTHGDPPIPESARERPEGAPSPDEPSSGSARRVKKGKGKKRK
jgi:prolipoprotein diacylglyceryltransferase